MNIIKSETPSKYIAGNAKKYESYHEAWSRIKLAQEPDLDLTIKDYAIS